MALEPNACCSVSREPPNSVIGNVDLSFRAQLKQDMLEVAKEQQQAIQKWVTQLDTERSVQIDQHMRTITALMTQMQTDLSGKANSPLRELGTISPDRNDTAPISIAEDKQREVTFETPMTIEYPSTASKVRKQEFVRRFMDDKVKSQSRTFQNLDVITQEVQPRVPHGSSESEDSKATGLSIHLMRLQKRTGLLQRKRQRLSTAYEDEHRTRFFLRRIVDSRAFTSTCAFAILTNTIFIGIEVDTNMSGALTEPVEPVADWWKIVNRVFTAIFFLELAIRFAAYRSELFTNDDMYWNIWDVIVVASSILEELVAEMLGGVNFNALRALRVLRLVRTLRIIRVVRFFRQLRLMVCCILNGIMQLAWALVLLILLMSLFSIVCVQAAAEHIRDYGGTNSTWHGPSGDGLSIVELREAIELNYPSIWRASMAMLMSVSGGMDWYDVMNPLLNISYMYALLFVLFVVFVVFGVLNVLTGIFVEQALQVRDRDLIVQAEMENIDRFLADMQDIFMEADLDTSGMVTKTELDKFLNQDRVLAYMSVHGLDVSDMATMFRLLDQDHTGQIEIHEWLLGCLRLRGQAKCIDVMRIVECCDLLCTMLQDVQDMLEVRTVTQTVARYSERKASA